MLIREKRCDFITLRTGQGLKTTRRLVPDRRTAGCMEFVCRNHITYFSA